jgi:hypothetical protein
MGEAIFSSRDSTIRVRCVDDVIYDAIAIHIFRKRQVVGNGPVMLEMLGASWTEVGRADEGIAVVECPAIRLGREHAQALMDELWNCGLRPKEGTGSAGAMAATQLHLKDLQKLVDRFVVPGGAS